MYNRIAVIGDLHLGKHLYGVDLTDHILDVMREFFTFATKMHATMAVVLGDVYDTPTPHIRLQKAFIELCNMFESAGMDLCVMPGNHDVVHSPGIGSALEPVKLAPFENVHIIDRPWALEHLLFLPFPSPGLYPKIEDYNTEAKALIKGFGPDQGIAALAHANVDGAELGSQEFVYRGGEHTLPDGLQRFRYVINGHIHKSQVVGNVVMPGSAERMSFGEVDDIKEFLFISSDGSLQIFRREGLYLRELEVDVSGWSNAGRAPTTEETIAYFNTLDVDGALVKLTPFVDHHSSVNWAWTMDALYKGGARHVFLNTAVTAEPRAKPIPKHLITDPLEVAKAFIKRKIKDKNERRAVLKLFRQMRKRLEKEEEGE